MTLLLDPDIRDWVVLPLFVIMVAAGLLRNFLGVLLAPAKTKQDPLGQRAQHTLSQCSKVRSGAAHYMPTSRWYVRKQHAIQILHQRAEWCIKEHEKKEASDDDDPTMALMNNPLGMLKGNMAFMVQKYVG